jgi:hypothetical protein
MAREWNDAARRRAPGLRRLIARALRGPRRLGWIDRSLQSSIDFLIDCRTVRSRLSDAHDGALPRWQAALLRAHVSTCAVCAPVDESLRSTIALLRELREECPPPGRSPPGTRGARDGGDRGRQQG